MVPSFREVLTACAGHRRALLNLVRMVIAHTCLYIIVPDSVALQLQDLANRARSDDVAKMNTCIVDYLQPLAPEILTYDEDKFPLPDRNHLEERGWVHPEYGSLLYPQVLCDSFNPMDYM